MMFLKNIELLCLVTLLSLFHVTVESSSMRLQVSPNTLEYMESSVMNYLSDWNPSMKFTRLYQQRSFHFIAFQRDFIIDLQLYYPTDRPEVVYMDGEKAVGNGTFIEDVGLLYQGTVRGSETQSFVFGRFLSSTHFIGYFLLDEPYFIEDAGYTRDRKPLIKIYKSKDAVYPGCSYFYFGVTCDSFYGNPLSEYNNNVLKKRSVNEHQELKNDSLLKSRFQPTGSEQVEGDSDEPQNYISTFAPDTISTTSTEIAPEKSADESHITTEHIPDTETLSPLSEYKSNVDEYPHLVLKTTTPNVFPDEYPVIVTDKPPSIDPNDDEYILAEKRKFIESEKFHLNFTAPKLENVVAMENLNCEVEVIVDASYAKARDFQNDSVLADVYAMIAFVDKRLRAVDFDGDKKSDNIGVVLKTIHIHLVEKNSLFAYPKPKSHTLSRFLKGITIWHDEIFELRRSAPCLLIVLAGKDVLEGGIAHSQEPRACSKKPAPIFLTDRISKRPIPLGTHFLSALIHVSRALGVRIGPVEKSDCKGPVRIISRDWFGDYVKMLFSECRVRDAGAFLSPAECFKKADPLAKCGNGVKEGSEKCDCGPPHVCQKVDPCCTEDCQYANKDGRENFCSYEQPCCNENCELVRSEEYKPCGLHGAQCDLSTCNGTSPECPMVYQDSLFGKQCMTDTDTLDAITCSFGRCVTPQCMNALTRNPCRCPPTSFHQCRICCMNIKGECLPADMAPGTSVYKRPTNTPCLQKGRCNSSGYCETESPVLEGRMEVSSCPRQRFDVTFLLLLVFFHKVLF